VHSVDILNYDERVKSLSLSFHFINNYHYVFYSHITNVHVDARYEQDDCEAFFSNDVFDETCRRMDSSGVPWIYDLTWIYHLTLFKRYNNNDCWVKQHLAFSIINYIAGHLSQYWLIKICTVIKAGECMKADPGHAICKLPPFKKL